MPRRAAPLLCALFALIGCRQAAIVTGAPPRQLHLAGSSATYPFSAAAAERFTRDDAGAIAPLVQADGSGSGIARFCGKLRSARPDIVGTTRPPTAAEQAVCARNGIGSVATIRFGWSALVLASGAGTSPLLLTRDDLRRALTGAAATWHAVDPRLPELPIRIEGPAPRPAIADGLFDLLLACPGGGCVRTDGRYRGHGASDPLALDAALTHTGALALVPWSYAVEHGGDLRLAAIDGVLPSTDTIVSGRYPLRLPLMLMVREADVRTLPSLRKLLALYADGWTSGAFQRQGLVPLDPAARVIATAQIASLTHE